MGGSGFGGETMHRTSPKKAEVTPSLDVEETKQIHLFDFLLGTKIDITTVYGKHLSLTVKP